MIRRCNRFKHS